MKTCFAILMLLATTILKAQENGTESRVEQQLEQVSANSDIQPEDDSYQLQLDHVKKHPVHINNTNADELKELNLLSDLQIEQLISYVQLFGKLINIYELQAIPGWDIMTIKKLLPYITVNEETGIMENIGKQLNDGDHTFLMRYSGTLEHSKGYDKPVNGSSNYYVGSPDKLFFRYNYNYKNQLEWGILGDKDAGEQFFKGSQPNGFDFYSFHFFVRRPGLLKTLAIGDFTVNMGQGLIQWQHFAFSKGAEITNSKRQGAVLMPYHAAGEYNFHRGIGITLQHKSLQTTLFGSVRNLSGNRITDTLSGEERISSFQVGGYHRTPAELADKNSLRQTVLGGVFTFKKENYHISINVIHYGFSKELLPPSEPYNLFSIKGTSHSNASIDYSYTFRNIHFFGEAATDNKYNIAILQGALVAVDAKTDLSLVYRNIRPGFQSINGNAFTDNASPENENGLFAGISLRPALGMTISAYYDFFHFHWLKYRVDAPSVGNEYFVQWYYTPSKQTELYSRFRNRTRALNSNVQNQPMTSLSVITERNWRFQTSFKVNNRWSIRNRLEYSLYNTLPGNTEEGYLSFVEGFYKSGRKNWSLNMRVQYFETGGFNSRIYAYENDVLYNYSIPSYYDKGFRYYFNAHWDVGNAFKKMHQFFQDASLYLKLAQTIYNNKTVIGSGLDVINGNKRTDMSMEIILSH